MNNTQMTAERNRAASLIKATGQLISTSTGLLPWHLQSLRAYGTYVAALDRGIVAGANADRDQMLDAARDAFTTWEASQADGVSPTRTHLDRAQAFALAGLAL